MKKFECGSGGVDENWCRSEEVSVLGILGATYILPYGPQTAAREMFPPSQKR